LFDSDFFWYGSPFICAISDQVGLPELPIASGKLVAIPNFSFATGDQATIFFDTWP
jgi:hypothetical protein